MTTVNETKELSDVETFFFADETKFSLNDNDPEDTIYYFLIRVYKSQAGKINALYDKILSDFGINKVFHATDVFKEKKVNAELMNKMSDLIVENKLPCFCFKYQKDRLFSAAAKQFSYLNDESTFNFDNHEFQAVFFLIQCFDYYLQRNPNLIQPKGLIFFDRSVVYGANDLQAFDFDKHTFLKRMLFINKKKIKLIGLPDFFGYIFRKSKLSQNKVQLGDNSLVKSPLVAQCYESLLKINQVKLFHFIDLDSWMYKV